MSNSKIKTIIKRLISGLLITTLFAIGIYLSNNEKHIISIVLVGTLVSIVFSKAYLIPFAAVKTTGVITKLDVETSNNRPHAGAAGPGQTYGTITEFEVTVHVKTDKGKTVIKTFPYKNENLRLVNGLKISFTPLDDYPTVY